MFCLFKILSLCLVVKPRIFVIRLCLGQPGLTKFMQDAHNHAFHYVVAL